MLSTSRSPKPWRRSSGRLRRLSHDDPGTLTDGVRLTRGRTELRYTSEVSPGEFGRLYRCMLKMRQDSRHPELIVLEPDLKLLAQGRTIPHIYPHKGRGTKLCLWWPKAGDWAPQMKLSETFVSWTAEWLYFFEDWLACGEWRGGGEHPDMPMNALTWRTDRFMVARRRTLARPTTA